MRALSTATPFGSTSCPSASDAITLFDFGYRSGADTVLWWATSGCQSLTNGRLTAHQELNPGWDGFAQAVESLLRAG